MKDATEQSIACINTDRELWRERLGDFYADSLFVTEGGGIGLNVGGYCIVKPIREWHKLASWQPIDTAPKDGSFIWLSNGFFMRIGYWYVVTKDPSKEHWADMIRAERGGMGDLQWTPIYWMPLPQKPRDALARPEGTK